MRLSGRQQDTNAGSLGAYLTVFLSLTLTVILSLIVTLIYGVRVNTVRMQCELLMDTAQNSCLAEYCRAMLERYDLFFVDTSYGSGTGTADNTERHFQQYLEDNCRSRSGTILGRTIDLCPVSVDLAGITQTRFACDDDYAALEEQIQAYMSADPAGGAASELLSHVTGFRSLGLDTGEWEREERQVQEQFQAARDAAAQQETVAMEGENTGGDAAEASPRIPPDAISDPGQTTEQFRALPLITQVFGAGNSLSHARVETDSLVSHRQLHYGDGIRAENSHHYERASALVMSRYIFEKCGTYRHPHTQGTLAYEVEYLLCGQDSDQANLEGVLRRILGVRTAANCVYLFSNEVKRHEAEAFAGTIAAFTLTPELTALYTAAIMLAWGYVESIEDCRTLVFGGKVPLLKDERTWKTSVGQILHPEQLAAGPRQQNGRESAGESGLDYEDYLGIFLYLASLERGGDTLRDGRLGDIMEMNIRRTPGNEKFCLDACMDTFTAAITVSGSIGYSCSMTRTITYN